MNDLGSLKVACTQDLLKLYKKANAGHIGASLSCLDLLIDLHFKRIKEEDQFILSKGHAAGALYTVLAKAGKISPAQLETFYQDGTHLAAHPPCGGQIDGITFGTGSLGHGLSLATGIAFAKKLKKNDSKVYCILSDGECDEGSTWEAALFAAHHQLKNLTVIIDYNGLQGLGSTNEIINLEPFSDKWKAFNFETVVVENGNDFSSIDSAFNKLDSSSSKPRCLIAKTTKGSGVSFMENKFEWHYLPMNEDQFQTALKENR